MPVLIEVRKRNPPATGRPKVSPHPALLAGLIVAWLALGLPGRAMAVTADPNPQEFRQPDGSAVTLRMRGDERMHWLEDTNGYPVLEDAGTYRYAQASADGGLIATPFVVGQVDPASVGLSNDVHLRLPVEVSKYLQTMSLPEQAATTPTTGMVKNLVVLCLFSDHTVAANGRAPAAYDSLFNMPNGSGINAPSGSVRDFYFQSSYGALTLQSGVIAWVTLPHTEAYYGNGLYGEPFASFAGPASPYPTNAPGMVHDALAIIDGFVNFADFDQNNDGYVDAIDFIHSGYGGESTNNANNIWSHKYNLSAMNGGGAWSSADQNANHVNVKVDLYHTEPARFGKYPSADLVRVGVIAHETGHFFGLPDLYDLDLSSSGAGNWCTMGNAWGWNNSQLYPPDFSAWCKLQLGWVYPFDVTGPGYFTLDPAETTPGMLRVYAGMPAGEYLLIENREPIGFDQQLFKGGIAIWHIDDNVGANNMEGYPGQAGWPGNGNHYKVALMQADGRYDLEKKFNNGDYADLYRQPDVGVANESSTPSTDSYVGACYPTGIDIRVTSDAGTTMGVWVRPSFWVDFSAIGPELGSFVYPYHTLTNAANAAVSDGSIVCKGGHNPETPLLNKSLLIRSWTSPTTIGQ